jgi:hypothetical protein
MVMMKENETQLSEYIKFRNFNVHPSFHQSSE